MKKKIVSVCLVVCLLATAIIGTTLAYFTDKTEVVKNTFTSGNVTITLDETKVDKNGVPVEPAERTEGNEYKLVPGHTYVKDPTVWVDANSEDCYVFVEVNVTDNIVAILDDFALNNTWTKLTEGDGINGIYYYNVGAVEAGDDLEVFGEFTVGKEVKNADLEKVTPDDAISVVAYAVQAEGFTSAQAAWDATFGA